MAETHLNDIPNVNDDVEYVDVVPLGKGKRVLVYLSDLFLTFLMTLFIFSAIVFPIYGKATGYFQYRDENNALSRQMVDILYENKLYEVKDGADKYDFDTNLVYTADLFLKDKIEDKSEHDYFATFYLTDLKMDESELVEIYKTHDLHHFFEFDENKPVLKEQYKKEFAPLLDPKDKIASAYQNDYNSFVSSFFASSMYANLVTDLIHSERIGEGSPLFQYRLLKQKQDNNTKFHQSSIVYSVYISFFLAAFVLFFLVPLITRRSRTVTMLMMRVERVSFHDFKSMKWHTGFFYTLYMTFASLPLAMFVPMLYIKFTELFALPQLGLVSWISLAVPAVSLIFLLTTSASQTLMDFASRSVMIDKQSMERIYVAKGYHL